MFEEPPSDFDKNRPKPEVCVKVVFYSTVGFVLRDEFCFVIRFFVRLAVSRRGLRGYYYG